MRWWLVNFKRIIVVVVFVLVFQMVSVLPKTYAVNKLPKIVITYMASDNIPNERIYFIEATFAAFADEIVLIPVNQVTKTTINESDVLVFIGDIVGNVPNTFKEAIESYPGIVIALGSNVEQLPTFNNWHFLGKEYIRKIDGEQLLSLKQIVHTIPPKGSELISVGENVTKQFPYIVKNGRHTYIAATSFDMVEKYTLSRSIYSILELKQPIAHQAFIQLEGISPISDPKLVKETGEFLVDRGIPLYLSVSQIHVDSVTGEQITLAQNEELVKVLKNLQSRGGMIIAHGYSQTYRFNELEKGFEFWDVQYNQKITTSNTDEVPSRIKSRNVFPSEKDYQNYISEINGIEKNYIEDKMTKSIEQLTDVGLYPISFQAPSDAMSVNGYKVTSQFFSSMFGKIQLSDDTWKLKNAPLFISEPAILSGMKIYPETIENIDTSIQDPFKYMKISIDRLKTVPGSVIGGNYHTYLGLEYLKEMVELIESVPNIEWLDLRETDQSIQTKRVVIKQVAGKPLEVTSSFSPLIRLHQLIENRPFDFILWVIASIVTVSVIVFFMYILGLRAKLRKRLFKERK